MGVDRGDAQRAGTNRPRAARPVVTLGELRDRIAALRQEEVAQRLGVRQGSISRIEGRGDLKVSTLMAYVGALGGVLELTVRIGRQEFALDIEETRGMKRPRQRVRPEQVLARDLPDSTPGAVDEGTRPGSSDAPPTDGAGSGQR